MTLQDRILEALGPHGLPPAAIYQSLPHASSEAIDCALKALFAGGKIYRALGAYRALAPVIPGRCVRAPRRRICVGDELTPREEEVAELAAAGKTLGQIAIRLGIEKKTACGHLSHVYTKLRVRGRVGLAQRLRERASAGTAATEEAA